MFTAGLYEEFVRGKAREDWPDWDDVTDGPGSDEAEMDDLAVLGVDTRSVVVNDGV